MAQVITFTGPQGGPGGGELSPGQGSTGFSSRIIPWANSSGQLTANSSGPVWDSTGNWLGVGTTAPSSPLTVQSSGGISQRWLSSAGADQVVVDSSGRVGIGTTAPIAALEISQSGALISQLIRPGVGEAQITISGGFADGQAAVTLLGVSTGTGAGVGVALRSRTTANTIEDAVVASHTGNVGIGTTAPGAKLDVAGIARLSTVNSTAVGSTGAGAAPPASPKTYIATILADGSSARLAAYTT